MKSVMDMTQFELEFEARRRGHSQPRGVRPELLRFFVAADRAFNGRRDKRKGWV